MDAAGYHAATRHSPSSVRAAGHRLDWANRPLPFKRYSGLDPVALPTQLPESDLPAVAVLSGEVEAGAEPVLDLAQLARLLFYSAGVTRRLHGVPMRTYASAGALYPIEVYPVCAELPGLAAGVYHFDPERFALHRLRDGDHRGHLARAAAAREVAAAPASLVLSGIPWRTTWKYRERGYRHLFWDAGTLLANLLAAAAACGLETRLLVGFADREVSALLGLDEDGTWEEYPLAVVRLGRARTAPAAAGGFPPRLRLEVEPLSPQPIAYRLTAEVHMAGALDDAEDVAGWRSRAASAGGAVAAGGRAAPETTRGERLEAVVLRRGSTRRFARREIPAEGLTWALEAATRSVAADFLAPGRSLLEHHLTVHAVDGVEPGAYRLTPNGLFLVARGGFRHWSAHLCLDQDLGGDAAYTVYHGCELEPLLRTLGDRGYRAAQLEAGIAAGRLYLAAHALGLGASSLTFYDDEVSEFFSTTAATMLATAVGVPAYRARPGRPPT